MLERHRHHSVHEVYYGTREQVQEADDERDNDNDATGAKQDGERDDERDDDQDAIDPRHNIQERLRRASNVIISDTYANRPQCTRSAIDKYQAGTKTVTKRPGRGRGRGREGGGD